MAQNLENISFKTPSFRKNESIEAHTKIINAVEFFITIL